MRHGEPFNTGSQKITWSLNNIRVMIAVSSFRKPAGGTRLKISPHWNKSVCRNMAWTSRNTWNGQKAKTCRNRLPGRPCSSERNAPLLRGLNEVWSSIRGKPLNSLGGWVIVHKNFFKHICTKKIFTHVQWADDIWGKKCKSDKMVPVPNNPTPPSQNSNTLPQTSQSHSWWHCIHIVVWHVLQNTQRLFHFPLKVFSLLDWHFRGPKHTTLNCPLEIALDFNPSERVVQGYFRDTWLADFIFRETWI